MKILILMLIPLLLLSGCDLFAPSYQADFYECETEEGTVLWTCVVDTGPPTENCGEKSSGTTTTKPTTC